MSVRRIMDALRLSAAILLLLSLFSCGSAIQFPDSHLTRKWAMQMQEELVQLIDAETGIQELQKIFLQFRNHYNVKQNNATQLVAKAAREIEKLLASRSKALEALATAAENLQKEHQWKDDLDVNDTIYYNAKDKFDINDTETRHNCVKLEFKEDPAFKRPVSYSTTAVHIPTDIYEGCEYTHTHIFACVLFLQLCMVAKIPVYKINLSVIAQLYCWVSGVDSQRLVEKLQTKFREQPSSNAARLAPE
ncbi:voltage-dependent calcium channel subunit alpha-2/delta-1-like [Sinocyclocheilus grahami]|uniref:voltage-dependent calcium channel subunit alpha-2/delta-1-like n=1 Tax=Sinocyclocheilus grahami TaxID=75366 RepID=UPI0007ACB9F8|nr:PREDICTED: voltage-dependent calcium channel subunit alpha-2/delta-1-like [Sinocyclocheilus grahami]